MSKWYTVLLAVLHQIADLSLCFFASLYDIYVRELKVMLFWVEVYVVDDVALAHIVADLVLVVLRHHELVEVHVLRAQKVGH